MDDVDLDLLKAVVDRAHSTTVADSAVRKILRELYETPRHFAMWKPIYSAIKDAYAPAPNWGDDSD